MSTAPMPPRRRSGPVWPALALAAAAWMGACSGGDVVVQIDLQSFLTDSGTLEDPHVDYGALVLPITVTLRDLPVLEPTSVDLVDAIEDLTDVRAVRLRYEVETVNRDARGSARVRLRLASTRDALDTAIAVADTLHLDLERAARDTVVQVVDLGPEFVALFRGTTLWFAADADVSVPAAALGDSIAGRIWLRALDARIVADEDFF